MTRFNQLRGYSNVMAKNGGKYRPVAKPREKMVHKAQNLESDEFARDDRYLAASNNGIVLLQDSYLSFISQRLTSEWAKQSSEIIRLYKPPHALLFMILDFAVDGKTQNRRSIIIAWNRGNVSMDTASSFSIFFYNSR